MEFIFEFKRTPIKGLIEVGRVLNPPKFDTEIYNIVGDSGSSIISRQQEFILDFLNLERDYHSDWSNYNFSRAAVEWHTDGVNIICLIGCQSAQGTLFSQDNKIYRGKSWRLYLIPAKLKHRGPKVNKVRICIRTVYKRNLEEIDKTIQLSEKE